VQSIFPLRNRSGAPVIAQTDQVETTPFKGLGLPPKEVDLEKLSRAAGSRRAKLEGIVARPHGRISPSSGRTGPCPLHPSTPRSFLQ